ncbi:hypothetical protein [Agriterribacter sp.]|nr:hypothetical protein [Agriterribacter sp.]HRO47305.1 hypothetical protein [Agriterribacter sp.]HRQ18186.1 hypothetical protein [Agriterribacter sp.]
MEQSNERPPVFKSWNAWYFIVVAVLVLLIVLFTYFTKTFS